MVLKKDLIGELRKFNKELEKHVGSISTDLLVDNSLDSHNYEDESQESYQENQMLLTSSLVDIRTEMSLLRKNFTNDIENIVLNSVEEQQQVFMDSMKSFQNNLALEMKKNFGFELKDIVSQISEIKQINNDLHKSLNKKNLELETLKENQLYLTKMLENSSIVQDFEYEKLAEDISEIKQTIKDINENSSFGILEKFEEILNNKLSSIQTQLDMTNSNQNKLFHSYDELEPEIRAIGSDVTNKLNSFEDNFDQEKKFIKSSSSELNKSLSSQLDSIKDSISSNNGNYKDILSEIHIFENNVEKKLVNESKNNSLSNGSTFEKKNKKPQTHFKKNNKLLSIEKNLANLERSIGQSSSKQISDKVYDLDNKLKNLNLVD